MEQRRRSHLLYNENGTKRPIVNIILVVVNVLVWCIMELSGDTLDGAYIISYGGLYPDLVLESHEWYRLITAMFLHFGPQHLANNMILLAAAGFTSTGIDNWAHIGGAAGGFILSILLYRKPQET